MTERTERKEKVTQLEEKKIRKHVEKLLEKYGWTKTGDIAITAGSKVGDNYTSSVFRVTVKGTGTKEQAELSFIAKRPPIDESRREIVHFDRMFSRELSFYSLVIPIFSDLLAEHDITLNLFPKLCATGTEYGDEIFIMQDLAGCGYRMHTSKILDYQHLAITLRFLGKFHACSFALRVKKPEMFEKLKSIEEPIFRQRKTGDRPHSLRGIPLYNIIAKALADEDTHYRERFSRFIATIGESLIEAVRGSAAEPYAVVNHGDAWTNNILFKYSLSDLNEEEPVDLRFVDFQLHRYASPVLDILYLLFCCSTYTTRKASYETLLQVYYDSLSKSLESFGCDSSILFPHHVFMQHLRQYGKFAAGMATYVLHVFTEDEVEIETKLDASKLEKRLETDPLYKRTIIETYRDLIDRNYI